MNDWYLQQGGLPLVGTQESPSYDMLGGQLHTCNPVKYGYATCLPQKDGGVPFSTLPKDTVLKVVSIIF